MTKQWRILNNGIVRWYLRSRNAWEIALCGERGAETVEVVVMGVVVVALLGAIMTVFSGRGGDIGGAFVDSLKTWAGKIGGN